MDFGGNPQELQKQVEWISLRFQGVWCSYILRSRLIIFFPETITSEQLTCCHSEKQLFRGDTARSVTDKPVHFKGVPWIRIQMKKKKKATLILLIRSMKQLMSFYQFEPTKVDYIYLSFNLGDLFLQICSKHCAMKLKSKRMLKTAKFSLSKDPLSCSWHNYGSIM